MPFTTPESRRIVDTCFDEMSKVLKGRGKMQPADVLMELNKLSECARIVLSNVEKKKLKKAVPSKKRKKVNDDDVSEQEEQQQMNGQ